MGGQNCADASPLERMRLARCLPLTYVAARVGVCAATMRAYETGKSRPSPARLMLLAELFGVEPSALLENTKAVA